MDFSEYLPGTRPTSQFGPVWIAGFLSGAATSKAVAASVSARRRDFMGRESRNRAQAATAGLPDALPQLPGVFGTLEDGTSQRHDPDQISRTVRDDKERT
jgi:hypothetical protein